MDGVVTATRAMNCSPLSTAPPLVTIAITGVTGDVGYTACKLLAAERSVKKLVVTARTTKKCEAVVAQLVEATGKPSSFFQYIVLDLDSIDSIMAAVKAFPTVDYICLNAGGFGDCKIHEASGATDCVVSNALGHSVLSDELLKLGKIKSRIVYVGSEVSRTIWSFKGLLPDYYCFSEPDIEWAMTTNYNADCGPCQPCCCLPIRRQMGDYKNAKIVGQLFYLAVARESPEIYTVTISPGAVGGSFAGSSYFPVNCLLEHFSWVFRCACITHPMEDGVGRFLEVLTPESPEYESGSMLMSGPNCLPGCLWGALGPITDNRPYRAYLADEELAKQTAAKMREYQDKWKATGTVTPKKMFRFGGLSLL